MRQLKDPASALTHFAGLILAALGLGLLAALTLDDHLKMASMVGYALSLVAVFLSSTAYHAFDLGTRGNLWLQKIDHSAIFLLIAGTYAPALLHLLDGTWRVAMFAAVFGLALAGVLLKLLWIDCPTWLSVGLYVGLGWIALIPSGLILPQLEWVQLLTLLTGGLAYTIGAVVFALEWPDPWPERFGHHEVWHLFVLAGAGAHFWFVLTLVGQSYPPL